jgi:hypothetical protein
VGFVDEPKRLMRFNLIVDKTLDGAIYMIKGLAFRQLRALGERLPVAHLPVFLDHLEHFFHDQSPVQYNNKSVQHELHPAESPPGEHCPPDGIGACPSRT